MTINKNKVVNIHYTLTDNEGVIIDTSQGREPLTYLHGAGNIIEGLESELEGKVSGDKLEVTIAPENGYGLRNEALLQKVSRENFPTEVELAPGMQFQTNTEQEKIVFTVIKIQDDSVIVDGNHPLAGVILNFKVEVMDIRDASDEEISHGHAHEPGGHEH